MFPDASAVVRDDGTHVTYRQFRHRALRLAEALRGAGIGPECRVAVLANNDLPLLEAHYGVPASGGVLVALNTRLSSNEYAYILDHCEAEVVIFEAGFSDQVQRTRDELDGVNAWVQIGGEPAFEDVHMYEEWLPEGTDARALSLPEDETRPITINYTSGTTGTPKGAFYTHRGAYLNALGQALGLQLTPRSVYLWTLPMFHCNGWCFTWAVTAVGGEHICMSKFDSTRTLDLIESHAVTHFCGAPVVLNSIAHDPTAPSREISNRVAATGGAPPSPTVISRMDALGIDVVHLYGLTETYGPSLICEVQESWSDLPADDRAEFLARQGVRTINVEGVRVVDDALSDVPPDGETVGEIVVRSNSVMRGYLGEDDATEDAFSAGWFHTGDLAVVHPDGYIEIRDRMKDIIISGGENISSIEVENAIAAHPGILEVAVVARPHEKWGDVPMAFVMRQPDAHLTEEELISWVRDRIAHFKAPKHVEFRELPKSSTGKIRKTELRGTVLANLDTGGREEAE